MVLKPSLRWGFPCAAALGAVLAIGWIDPRPEPVLRAQLFKQTGKQASIELAPGDRLASGDELYMILEVKPALHVYVVSEDAAGERLVIYPCRTWGRSPRLAAAQPHRLPEQEGFWQVRSVTPRERLLVIASPRPVDFLDEVFMAAENPKPCVAVVGVEASRWIDDLLTPSKGFFEPLRKVWDRKPETWTLTFDLKGTGSHG